MSLNYFIKVQRLIVLLRWLFYVKFWGMNISRTSVVSLKAKLDKTHPNGVHIGDYTYIAFEASILTHDMVRGLKVNTYIGSNCFIGAKSLILPGVSIGNSSIVAAGSVVTKDVPSNCIVAGNPARVIRSNIRTKEFGVLINE